MGRASSKRQEWNAACQAFVNADERTPPAVDGPEVLAVAACLTCRLALSESSFGGGTFIRPHERYWSFGQRKPGSSFRQALEDRVRTRSGEAGTDGLTTPIKIGVEGK